MGSEEFIKLGQLMYEPRNEENNMRILKGYSKEVQKDFENLKENYSFPLFEILENELEDVPDLKELINNIDDEDTDKQLLQDIADFINGKAEFPEQKYYVKLLDRDEGYLNQQRSFKECFVDDNDDYGDDDYQTQFTMEEIEAIDPRFKQFAIPVED